MAAMTVMASLPLKADEAGCKAVLHDCDQAVQDLQKENSIQKQIISDEQTRFNTEHHELEAQEIWRPIAIGGIVVISVETVFLLLKH